MKRILCWLIGRGRRRRNRKIIKLIEMWSNEDGGITSEECDELHKRLIDPNYMGNPAEYAI